MSVINKMLRDLDHRQAVNTPLPIVGTVPVQFSPPPTNGTSGTLWNSQASGPGARRWVLPAAVCAMVVLALAAWAWWQPLSQRVTPTAMVVASGVAGPAVVLGPLPAVAVAVAANTSPTVLVLRKDDELSASRTLDLGLSTPAPAAVTVSAAPVTPVAPVARAASAPVVMASSTVRPKALDTADRAPVPVTAPPVVAAASVGAPRASVAQRPADNTPSIQRQQEAGGDALAQSLNLWNTGSRDAAMEILQQSVAAAERAAKAAGGGPGSSTLLAPLVRELARMQLAEGRHGAVWEMLTRLEPLLGNQADLWAVRANAAQRLGRHQDSVHAYMMALQSRPDEQRWLLGSAVSLAALGQTTAASEMAEKARAAGPVSKDVVAYLRQTGVVVRD